MVGRCSSIGYEPATADRPMTPGGDLYPTLIRKNPIKPIRIYLQDGDRDLSNEHGNWFLANQQMLSAFEYANARADRDGTLGTRYEVKHNWGDGTHSDQHGGTLLPEIEAALMDKKQGDQSSADVAMPAGHPHKKLKGKTATFKITLKDLKEKVLPGLDDDFAKSVGGSFETLDALKGEVRKGLQARRELENRRALEAAVLDAVLANHAFEVPEALVLRQVGRQIEHAREHMRRQGVDPDRVPWDYKKLLEDLRPGAEKAVKRALLLEAIAEKEGLEPGDADVDAEVERLAQASQRPAPAVRRMLEQSGDLEGIRHTLGERKTVDFLIEKNQANPA